MSFFASSLFLVLFLLTSSCIFDAAAQEGAPNSGPTPDPGPAPDPAIYNDCVEAQEKACQGSGSTPDRDYNIKSRNSAGFESTKCRGDQGTFTARGCTGSGWTFVGSLTSNMSNSDTAYDSPIWTAKGDSQTVFNSHFWSANVSEVCLVSQDNFIAQFPVQAPSLRSLFFQKRLVDRTAQQWLNDFAGNAFPFFPDGCYESGFNVGNPSFAQARIGVVSLTGTGGCISGSPQVIGIGVKIGGLNYGSAHGAFESDIYNDFDDFDIYVRS